MEIQAEESNLQDPKAYEIGYLLTPLIPTDKLEEATTKLLAKNIEAAGGTLLYQTSPKLRTLAYPLVKMVEKRGTTFKEAYFGSVKFQVVADKVKEVKEAFAADLNILRHLLIIAPRISDKVPLGRGVGRRPRTTPSIGGRPATAPTTLISKEQIDKEIEDLIASTA